MYRNTNKTVTNFFPYPQINQCVHVISNCEIVQNNNASNQAENNNLNMNLNNLNNFRLQTKITPIYTKNHGYPRLVQEFQFFINDAIIKYTNVTTSMPDRKDDAFMSQISHFANQNPVNDYYFDLGNQAPKSEEGKIIEEEERINKENPVKPLHTTQILNGLFTSEKPEKHKECFKEESSLFGVQQNKNHPFGHKAPYFASSASKSENLVGQNNREGSSLSGILLLPTQIPNNSDLRLCANDKPQDSSSDRLNNNQEQWRGECSVPDNKEEKKEIFKVVKKRICKFDRKINGCCDGGNKLRCKVQ